MRDFLCRIATTQLNMTRDEFDEMADSMVIDGVAQILNERAERLELNLPDMQRILQSTFDDQKMATKYHMEWIPPMVSRIDFLLQVFSLICFLRSVPMKKYCCRNMNGFQMFFRCCPVCRAMRQHLWKKRISHPGRKHNLIFFGNIGFFQDTDLLLQQYFPVFLP